MIWKIDGKFHEFLKDGLNEKLFARRGRKKKNIIDVSCVKTQGTQFYSLFCKMNNITWMNLQHKLLADLFGCKTNVCPH